MIDALAKAVLARDRRALSRAITLVESQAPAHRRQARELLASLLPQKPKAPKTLRLGISGSPGTGKSTLIEAFGAELLSRGHRLAVLAVDPSSQRSGGSIMGDKTRMPNLSAATNAYVRPSPSRGVLGGVARRTEDALLLCECGGHDRLIVETVGVGQSETAVAGLCDFFMLLVPPAAGDGLQGIKRGIMEVADLCVVTKADGDLLPAARAMAAELRPALKLLRPRDPCWTPSVVTSSALDPSSFSRLADICDDFLERADESGLLQRHRSAQAADSIWEHAHAELADALRASPAAQRAVANLAAEVGAGALSAGAAGERIAAQALRGIDGADVPA